MAQQLQVGDVVGPLEKPPVTKTQLVMYSGASGDFNPIHTVDEFAKEVGLGGVIAHGMLTMAFVGQMLTDLVGLDGMLKTFGVRFVQMVRPGDVIRCYGKVLRINEQPDQHEITLDVWAENQNGVHVVDGSATVLI